MSNRKKNIWKWRKYLFQKKKKKEGLVTYTFWSALLFKFLKMHTRCHVIPSDLPLTFQLYWSALVYEGTVYWKEEFINNYRETGFHITRVPAGLLLFIAQHTFLELFLTGRLQGSSVCQCHWELLGCIVLCKWCFLPLGTERFLCLFL